MKRTITQLSIALAASLALASGASVMVDKRGQPDAGKPIVRGN